MKDLAPHQPSLQPSNPAADDGRIAKEIRRCLELVQTCHQDLQHLIDLRNEHLKLLEAAPRRILDRINRVIDSANQGLVEGRRIVEKCRPKAHRGMKMTLHSRLQWVLCSSVDFRGQEPVIIRHNAAVLAELNYLRQITTWTLLDNIPTTKEDPDVAPLRTSQGTNKKGMISQILSIPLAANANRKQSVRKCFCHHSSIGAKLTSSDAQGN